LYPLRIAGESLAGTDKLSAKNSPLILSSSCRVESAGLKYRRMGRKREDASSQHLNQTRISPLIALKPLIGKKWPKFLDSSQVSERKERNHGRKISDFFFLSGLSEVLESEGLGTGRKIFRLSSCFIIGDGRHI